MTIARFPLNSEQLELLLAFEQAQSLSELAQMMGRDDSVVSRQLQKLAQAYPVLSKEKGRWMITPLGLKLNKLSAQALQAYNEAMGLETGQAFSFSHSALVVINAQKGLLSAKADRSNPSAENNIERLMHLWRGQISTVIHVQHLSENPTSLFYKASANADFLAPLNPLRDELVIAKNKSSAFSDTKLEIELKQRNIEQLILVGFTANECIEATARDAFERGFQVTVIADATAMFDFMGHDHKLYKAQQVHQMVLANIAALYANIENSDSLISKLIQSDRSLKQSEELEMRAH